MARKLIVDTTANLSALDVVIARAHGYTFPAIGRNAATGMPAPSKQGTDRWCHVRVHPVSGALGLVVDPDTAAIATDPTKRGRLTVQQRATVDARLAAAVDETDDWFVRRR
jgi:hypothetical protein